MQRSILYKLTPLLGAAMMILGGCCNPEANNAPVTGVQASLRTPDNGDGTYTNPIIQADYSDPDVIRVGADFYMVASSFGCAPGLPVLHSTDLVNWQLISYASPKVHPVEHYNTVQHGNGIWAPSLRHHQGQFYIFYGDPDMGIYMLKASSMHGPWTEPHLVKAAKGWIDPCPFWDEDGNAYLVHAYAGSRAGVKSVLAINRMAPDGSALLDDGVLVFDGHGLHTTVEGPKLYKRNGYYYILAPAGGVPTGWQLALRSKNIYGPYDEKIVLETGTTAINGPHQGGLVELENGENWFIHFQDQEAYGRILHLQPVTWSNDWPLMGEMVGNKQQPVITHVKPDVGTNQTIQPASLNDDFNSPDVNLAWQWHANPGADWGKPFPGKGVFRLYCQPWAGETPNLWQMSSLLLQKWPAREFTCTAKLNAQLLNDGERGGLVVMGEDYAALSICRVDGKYIARVTAATNARTGGEEMITGEAEISNTEVLLRLEVTEGGRCQLSFSTDQQNFQPIGATFTAKPGRWIGAKTGFFAQTDHRINDTGFLDIDWFVYGEE